MEIVPYIVVLLLAAFIVITIVRRQSTPRRRSLNKHRARENEVGRLVKEIRSGTITQNPLGVGEDLQDPNAEASPKISYPEPLFEVDAYAQRTSLDPNPEEEPKRVTSSGREFLTEEAVFVPEGKTDPDPQSGRMSLEEGRAQSSDVADLVNPIQSHKDRNRRTEAFQMGEAANESEETGASEDTNRREGIDTPVAGEKRKNRPRIYKPPVLSPPTSARIKSSSKSGPAANVQTEYSLPIAVRIYFQRGSTVDLSLLLGRRPEVTDSLDAAWLGPNISLFSLTDDWLEGIPRSGIGQLLDSGVEWETRTEDEKLLRWTLSGRPLFVLAPTSSLSGFVSTTRLVIGRQHVILCKEELLKSVQELLAEAESTAPEVFGSDHGLPAGWVCLRNVIPKKALSQAEGQDILNILRPLADIEIVLEGGIRIENSIWLASYPPKISIHGDLSIVERVVIDGLEAKMDENGAYSVVGWDQPGDHSIWAGQNRSYSIREMDEGWEIWQAHSYGLRKPDGVGVCGPLIVRDGSLLNSLCPVIVPAANSVIVGSTPGQILNIEMHSGKVPPAYGEFAPFQPVWALPANPYQVDKHTTSILYMHKMLLSTSQSLSPGQDKYRGKGTNLGMVKDHTCCK